MESSHALVGEDQIYILRDSIFLQLPVAGCPWSGLALKYVSTTGPAQAETNDNRGREKLFFVSSLSRWSRHYKVDRTEAQKY